MFLLSMPMVGCTRNEERRGLCIDSKCVQSPLVIHKPCSSYTDTHIHTHTSNAQMKDS